MNIEPNMALKLYEARQKCKPDEKVICKSANVIEIVKKTWWDKAQDRIFKKGVEK